MVQLVLTTETHKDVFSSLRGEISDLFKTSNCEKPTLTLSAEARTKNDFCPCIFPRLEPNSSTPFLPPITGTLNEPRKGCDKFSPILPNCRNEVILGFPPLPPLRSNVSEIMSFYFTRRSRFKPYTPLYRAKPAGTLDYSTLD